MGTAQPATSVLALVRGFINRILRLGAEDKVNVLWLKPARLGDTDSSVVRLPELLLGEELSGVAIPVARVTGIALIGLGLSCWPGPPLMGMVTYSAAVALYLTYVGVVGGFTGIFLWPAVVLHAILTVLLGSVWLTTKPFKRL